MNSIILKGVRVGNNVIIGAGSLVNKDIPDNSVVAGNPAKVIMSLGEYYEKRKNMQFEEAEELTREYRKVYNANPSEEELSEFFWLFTNGNDEMPECWQQKMRLVGNEDISKSALTRNQIKFKNMSDFLDSI